MHEQEQKMEEIIMQSCKGIWFDIGDTVESAMLVNYYVGRIRKMLVF